MYTYIIPISLVTFVLSGCGGVGSDEADWLSTLAEASTDVTNPMSPGKVSWLMINDQIGLIADASGEGATMASNYFDNGKTFDVTRTTPVPNSVQTLDFKGVTGSGFLGEALEQCANIPSSVKAIVLDIEDWSDTPPSERTNPAAAYATAYGDLKTFNSKCRTSTTKVILIATPGTDLADSVPLASGCTASADQFSRFLCDKLAVKIGPNCDEYEIQSQAAQNDETEFQGYVEFTAGQVHSVHPGIPLLAGLAADPARLNNCSVDVLFADLQNTFGSVSGYWLNVIPPAAGQPGCANGNTVGQLGAQLLDRMYSN